MTIQPEVDLEALKRPWIKDWIAPGPRRRSGRARLRTADLAADDGTAALGGGGAKGHEGNSITGRADGTGGPGAGGEVWGTLDNEAGRAHHSRMLRVSRIPATSWSSNKARVGFSCHLACNAEWRRQSCPAEQEAALMPQPAAAGRVWGGGVLEGGDLLAPVVGVPVDVNQARLALVTFFPLLSLWIVGSMGPQPLPATAEKRQPSEDLPPFSLRSGPCG